MFACVALLNADESKMYVLVQGMSFMNHYLERVPVGVSLQEFFI